MRNLIIIVLILWHSCVFSQNYSFTPSTYSCGPTDSGNSGIKLKLNSINSSNTGIFQIRKYDNSNPCSQTSGTPNFGTSGIMNLREGSINGTIIASCNLSTCGGVQSITFSNTFTHSGTKNYYSQIDVAGFNYTAGPISVTNTSQSITITNPTSGSFDKGCPMSIQWSSSNIGPSVSIELVSSTNTSNVITVIADPTSNDGNFSWTVGTNTTGAFPTNIPSGNYKLKIYETGSGAGVTYSSTFAITSPSLNITIPNGGENYNIGSTLPISWTFSNFCGSVSIELLNSANSVQAVIVDPTNNDGEYNWLIPSSIPVGAYRVKIYRTVSSGVSPVSDLSSGFFNINLPPPGITITNPTGGNFDKGCPMSIQWSSSNIGASVSIELVSSTNTSNVIAVIADPTSNDGNFSWTVGTNTTGVFPTNIPNGTYKIKMYETSSGAGVTYSSTFTITDPIINVVTPNGGENYNIGSVLPISWTFSNFCGSVSIELINSANSVQAVIVDPTNNDGEYNWTIPTSIPIGIYKIKIYKTVSNGTSPVSDISNAFFNINLPPPGIAITNPIGGNFDKGCAMQIQWTSSNIGANVSIELVSATNTSNVIVVVADPTSNDGNFSWTVGTNTTGVFPTNIPNGTYKIKMYETSSGAGVTYSSTFTITDPIINVVTPNGGENYNIGSVLPISWTFSNFCGSVSIELINSANSVQAVIVDPTNNDGEYNWTIPTSIPIGIYKIKIYKTVSNGTSPVSNISNAFFNINQDPNTCTVFTDLPNQGTDIEAYNAASCLCSLGYITPQNYGGSNTNGVNPNTLIFRADLAKLVYFAIYKGNASSPVSHFPSPFADLQNQNSEYFQYSKALSFLEYEDGVTSFDQNFINFLPYNNIQKRYALKVILEAYNIAPDNTNGGTIQGVTFGDDSYGYVHKAWDMGLISDPNGNATQNVLRRDIFIIMHRLLSYGPCNCDPNCLNPNPQPTDYYVPPNVTPSNMSREVSEEEGYFNHSPNSGLAIDGLGFDLEFSIMYSSYLAQLPTGFTPVTPLGKGWSFTGNSYVIKTPSWTHNNVIQPERNIVFWPDGKIDFYDELSKPMSEGNYDTLLINTSVTIVIRNKSQIKYYFTKQGNSSPSIYYLTQVEDRNGNRIKYTYLPADEGYKLTEITGTTNKKFLLTHFGSSNKIATITDVSGNRTLYFTYDNFNNLATYKNARGKIESYSYGNNPQFGLLTEITRPKANKILNTYSSSNRKYKESKVLNNNGVEIYKKTVSIIHNYNTSQPSISSIVSDINTIKNNTFNTLGLPSLVSINVNGANKEIQILYQDNSNPYLPTKMTYGTSNINTSLNYEYDIYGNPLKIILPDGSHHKYTYNIKNDVETYKDPNGNIYFYKYNTQGNLTSIINPLGDTIKITVNTSNGLVTKIINEENITEEFIYDSHGNPRFILLPLSLMYSIAYDPINRPISFTNPKNQVTTISYNANGGVEKKTRVSIGGNIVTQYFYDDNDNIDSIRNALNNSTKFSHDNAERTISMSFGDDTKANVYRTDGSILKVIKHDGTELYQSFDAEGKLLSDGYASFHYDAKSNIDSIIVGNNKMYIEYNNVNRIKLVKDTNGKIISYSYDFNGNLKQIIYPNNFVLKYDYDFKDRLIKVKWDNDTKVISYFYYKDDRINYITFPNGTKCTYTYDAAGRMIGQSWKKDNNSNIFSSTFALDQLGNHVSENSLGPYGSPSLFPINSSQTYNSENEPNLNHSFDENGNLIAGDNLICIWNDVDLPTQINSNQYFYNGMGLRDKTIINGVVKKYIWDIHGNGNILAETDDSGNIISYFIHGLGLLAKVINGQTYYYHDDFRGSIVAITDQSANIVNKYNYDPTGLITDQSEAIPNQFKYVGKYGVMSDNNYLHYMRARYMDSRTGRFLSEDPVWNENLFVYAENDPINLIDYDGAYSKNAEGTINFFNKNGSVRETREKYGTGKLLSGKVSIYASSDFNFTAMAELTQVKFETKRVDFSVGSLSAGASIGTKRVSAGFDACLVKADLKLGCTPIGAFSVSAGACASAKIEVTSNKSSLKWGPVGVELDTSNRCSFKEKAKNSNYIFSLKPINSSPDLSQILSIK